MVATERVLPGCKADVFLALAARRIVSAAVKMGKTTEQVPSLGSLNGLANAAMKITKEQEREFVATFNTLANLFGLDERAADLLLLCIAAELDERVYATALNLTGTLFGAPGPRVGSWLHILYPDLTERSAAFNSLLETSPLLRYKLVRVLGSESTPLSQRELCGEPSLLGHVLPGPAPGLPEELIGAAELVQPTPTNGEEQGESLFTKEFWNLLTFLLESQGARRVFHVCPLPSRAAHAFARIIASHVRRPMVLLDLRAVENEIDDAVALTLREARLRNGIPLFVNAMTVGDEEPNQLRQERVAQRWRKALALEQQVVIFAAETKESNDIHLLEQVSFDVSTYQLERVSLQHRRKLFADGFERARQGHISNQPAVRFAADISVDQLASVYRVGVGDIEPVLHHAIVSARLRANGSKRQAEVTAEDLFMAARERTRRDLGKFARRVESRYDWDDLVLPDAIVGGLKDFHIAIVNRARVYEDWGYGRKHVRGRGLSAIFWGESGTGKTMSAEVIARTLGVDLFQIDLAQVVSKWVGETERNLSQIFDASEGSDAILFFDEADSLFGKRTEVKESKDRYANIEVSYLLQRIESFDGICVLASNLRGHIDQAFLRRFQYGLFFPKPDEKARLAIWRRVFPDDVPMQGIDLEFLAREYSDVTGGQIRTIAVGAALLAAGEDASVTMDHVRRAHEAEQFKMQRVVMGGGPPNIERASMM